MSERTHIGPFSIRPHLRDGVACGWVVDARVRVLGKRKRWFFAQRSFAEKFAREFDKKCWNGDLDDVRRKFAPTAQPGLPRLTLRDAIEKWGEFQEGRVNTRKKKKVSLETDRMRLKASFAFFGDVELSTITEEKLTKFQEYRLNVEGRKPATINSDVIALGKVLRWAHKNGLITSIPQVERIPDDRPPTLLPTEEEVVIIIQALPERLRPLVTFLSSTGCRSGEAFHLTWDCVDEIRGTVEFRASGKWTPKTRSSYRKIPISTSVLELIRALPKLGKYVFAGSDPEKPVNNVKKAFATAVKIANIRREGRRIKITPHTLRKAYATWQATIYGMPPQVLQALLGHAPGSRVTDTYYVTPQAEAMRLGSNNIRIAEQISLPCLNSCGRSGNKVATEQFGQQPG